ncbi:MAG: endolytic transglycosylase MltG [Patescibacteria group bacterium]|nr:endolytic transglycosylase MltG [Patescibacteria group bacterium]
MNRFSVVPLRIKISVATAIVAGLFVFGLMPRAWGGAPAQSFEIMRGEGFREIVDRLRDERLIRSSFSLKLYSVLFGTAYSLKPGMYLITPSMSGPRILNVLIAGARKEIQVVVPEGSSIYDTDSILSTAGVLPSGAFSSYTLEHRLEGYLFPDTYKFFTGMFVEDVVDKFLDSFNRKAQPLLKGDELHAMENLILASLVEKEIPSYEDRQIVAGILKKRVLVRMPLQVDATICYIKKQRAGKPTDCYPLSPLDFTIDSPYNTYLRMGFPPQPIGSPGVHAIMAVLAPKVSPYWYYLSDPLTEKTVFSETLDEHEQNRVKYLKVMH